MGRDRGDGWRRAQRVRAARPEPAGATPPISRVLERNNHPSRDGTSSSRADQGGGGRRWPATPASQATFTGTMWASPLYLENGPGGKGVFFAVTTGNDVFALDETTGAMVWMHNIGSSPTGQRRRAAATSTRSASSARRSSTRASRTIFVAGAIGTTSIARHEVHALSVDDGTEKSGWPVDVSTVHDSGGLTFMPQPQNQRSALSLVDGIALRRLRRPRRRLRPVPRLGRRHQRGQPDHERRLGDGRPGRGDLGRRRAWPPTATASSRRPGNRTAADVRTRTARRSCASPAWHAGARRPEHLLPDALAGDGHGRRRTSASTTPSTSRCRARRRRRWSSRSRRTGTSTCSTQRTSAAWAGRRSTSRSRSSGMSIHTAPAAYRTAMGVLRRVLDRLGRAVSLGRRQRRGDRVGADPARRAARAARRCGARRSAARSRRRSPPPPTAPATRSSGS